MYNNNIVVIVVVVCEKSVGKFINKTTLAHDGKINGNNKTT